MSSLRDRAQSARRRARTPLLFFIAVLMVVASFPSPASAHAGDQSYLYMDIAGDVTVRFEMPFDDVRDFLDIDLSGDEDEVAANIENNADALRAYALEHFDVGPENSDPWEVTYLRTERIEEIDYVGVTYELAVLPEDVPQEIEISFDPFFDDLATRDALFIVGTAWNRGFIENESDSLQRFTPDSRTQVVDLGDTSQWKNFSASVPLGLDHIRTGVDHILFVAVLVLPAVLVFRESSWKPVDGFGSSLWRVLKIVTMFTVAHSITFTLAGIRLVPTPSARIVESIIAASIAFAALHNLRPVIPEKEWVIAFVFGLFHGFGFASLVAELDVSTTTQLVSLLGRNVGIEIGQALVVLLIFPGLFLLRRTSAYQPFFTIASILLIIASIGWMSERLFDAPGVTSTVLDAVFEFPRVLIGLAVLTVGSAVLYKYEQDRDQLRTTAGR